MAAALPGTCHFMILRVASLASWGSLSVDILNGPLWSLRSTSETTHDLASFGVLSLIIKAWWLPLWRRDHNTTTSSIYGSWSVDVYLVYSLINDVVLCFWKPAKYIIRKFKIVRLIFTLADECMSHTVWLELIISGMEPKGQPNEQMEEVVLQATQPKLVSYIRLEPYPWPEPVP